MLELFLAELKREWILQIRYAAEIISFVVGLTIAFYGLFQSAQYIAGPSTQFGDRLDSIVVGYVLWSLSIFILSDIAGGLQQEAQTGTLEQIFLSPFSGLQIFTARAVAKLTLQLILNLSILLIIMTLTGARLSFSPVLLLPLLTVLLGAYGLALAMGSLALLLKRVQQVLGIFQFLLFFVLMVPAETWAGSTFWAWLLPMTPGAELLRKIMAQEQPLDLVQFLISLFNGAAYLTVGLLLFQLAERRAKQHGKLGGY